MKIVVAMDSFKGGLAAAAVCRAVAEGLRDVDRDVETIVKPMADGGEGTAAALLAARSDGKWIAREVAGPLPDRPVKAGYARFGGDRTALVEMAAANGLPLLAEHERNPMLTGTRGTGQLIKAAAAGGAREILLAVGGSATVDGGVGAAAALGWRFTDAAGNPVPDGGGRLRSIARIAPPSSGTALPPIRVLCDVTNPLCGPRGAAAVFAPQKGATPAMTAILEEGLKHLAGLIRACLGRDVEDLPGGGAAGGLAAGAAAFLNARLTPGIAAVSEALRLREALREADWCLTGEGSFDRQSLDGKVVSGVAAAAAAAAVPVAVIAGRVTAAPEEYRSAGIRTALAIHPPEMPMEEVLRREPELLRATAARWLTGLSERNACKRPC